MKTLLGIELNEKEFDYLICQQNLGKELKIVNNKIIAMNHFLTQEELLQKEMLELENWFDKYDNQINQYSRCVRLGIEFDKDIKELDNQAQIKAQRISELRQLKK